MHKKISLRTDPARPMDATKAKVMKEEYANWENYKIKQLETTLRTQHVKKKNNGWLLRQDI